MGAIELCVIIGVIKAITFVASYYNASTGLPRYGNNIQQQAANNSNENRVHPGTCFQITFHVTFS